MEFAFLIIGLALGAGIAWFVARSRLGGELTRLRF
jgi:hypothetical protein